VARRPVVDVLGERINSAVVTIHCSILLGEDAVAGRALGPVPFGIVCVVIGSHTQSPKSNNTLDSIHSPIPSPTNLQDLPSM